MLHICSAICYKAKEMDNVSYNKKPRKLELEHFLFPLGFAESFIFDWAEKKSMPNHQDI